MTIPLPPPPETPLPSATPLRSSESSPVASVPMSLAVTVLFIELLMTMPLYWLPATTTFEIVLPVGLIPDLDAEGAVGCDAGQVRDDVEPDDVVGEDVGVAVVVEDAAAVEVGDLEPLDRAVVRVVVEREADRAGTGLGAVDLDQGLSGVSRLRRPVDGDRVGERWQRCQQRNCLSAASSDVEINRRYGPHWRVVRRNDRSPERARCRVVVVATVGGGGDEDG